MTDKNNFRNDSENTAIEETSDVCLDLRLKELDEEIEQEKNVDVKNCPVPEKLYTKDISIVSTDLDGETRIESQEIDIIRLPHDYPSILLAIEVPKAYQGDISLLSKTMKYLVGETVYGDYTIFPLMLKDIRYIIIEFNDELECIINVKNSALNFFSAFRTLIAADMMHLKKLNMELKGGLKKTGKAFVLGERKTFSSTKQFKDVLPYGDFDSSIFNNENLEESILCYINDTERWEEMNKISLTLGAKYYTLNRHHYDAKLKDEVRDVENGLLLALKAGYLLSKLK